ESHQGLHNLKKSKKKAAQMDSFLQIDDCDLISQQQQPATSQLRIRLSASATRYRIHQLHAKYRLVVILQLSQLQRLQQLLNPRLNSSHVKSSYAVFCSKKKMHL